jgi:hypothetical protein
MYRLLIIFFILSHSLNAWAQREPYADSLLLDAQYEKVIRWADQHSNQSKADTVSMIIVMTRKAEALIRLGKFE